MNIIQTFFIGTKTKTVVAVNPDGAMEGVYQGRPDGSFVKAPPQNTKKRKEKCWLVIPPGTCAVRNLQLDTVSAKDMEKALICLAQSSLLNPFEDGYTAIHTTQQGEQTMGVLFWCEKNFLDRCVTPVENAGFIVCGFLVPEMLAGAKKSCLLFYENNRTGHGFRLLCHAAPGYAPTVLSGGMDSPDREVLYTAMLEEIARQGAPSPENILFWQDKPHMVTREADPSNDLGDSLHNDGSINGQALHGWAEILPHLFPQAGPPKGVSRPFEQCLNREKQQPLERQGYFRLAAFLSVVLILAGTFITTLYSQFEHEISFLEKEAARVTRASTKATKATQIIRQLQKKNNTIRKFAQDKPYSLELLKIIAEATARQSRLDNISISRDGSIVINAQSKEAEHAMAIVEKLEESPHIIQCKITALNHETGHETNHGADSELYKFTIHARSQTWAEFFQEDES